MKRTYECMLLLDNREVKKGWDELKTSVTGLFEKHGAEVLSARRWDERRLTYPINRQTRATYLLMYFNADAPQVQAVRRDMEFNEAMLRNFVTSCEKIPDEAFEPEASFDMSSIRVDDDSSEGELASSAPSAGAAPEGAKSEGAKPKEAKPEEAKSEGAKPEGAKPEGAKPEGAKSEGAGKETAGGAPAEPGASTEESAK